MDRIKTLKSDDKDFRFVHKNVICSRAGFEISTTCPSDYRLIIGECINNGWLKPVAFMKESEYVWEKVKDQ